jgi:hypothetical protein
MYWKIHYLEECLQRNFLPCGCDRCFAINGDIWDELGYGPVEDEGFFEEDLTPEGCEEFQSVFGDE